MTSIPSQNSRMYVRKALEQYASFFASLAQGDEGMASKCIFDIRAIDTQAGEVLDDGDLNYYQSRRTYLMKIFREQLMVHLEGQIQEDLFERARDLAAEIERQ